MATDRIPPAAVFPFGPPDPEGWLARIRELPLRAIVVFALRCAKRLEPILRLGQLRANAFSTGLDLSKVQWYGGYDFAGEAAACAAGAVHLAAKYTASEAAAIAAKAVVTYDGAVAAAIDLKKLLELKLGKPGEPGEPIRWDDPRLGPLWPDERREWFVEVEQACRELEENLRNLPDPNAPPDDPRLLAQAEEYLKAQQWYCEGKFDDYRGEYVFFSDGIIFGHGRNLADLRPVMEEKAAALGIPPERLVDYFVPGK